VLTSIPGSGIVQATADFENDQFTAFASAARASCQDAVF
jgi:hypothetical protein